MHETKNVDTSYSFVVSQMNRSDEILKALRDRDTVLKRANDLQVQEKSILNRQGKKLWQGLVAAARSGVEQINQQNVVRQEIGFSDVDANSFQVDNPLHPASVLVRFTGETIEVTSKTTKAPGYEPHIEVRAYPLVVTSRGQVLVSVDGRRFGGNEILPMLLSDIF